MLYRIGDHANATALHRAIVEAGQQSRLSTAEVAEFGDGDGFPLTGAEAVGLARTALQQFISALVFNRRAPQSHGPAGPVIQSAGILPPCNVFNSVVSCQYVASRALRNLIWMKVNS